METSRRILVPYDFTPSSKRARDYAMELAGAVGGAVFLLFVIEPFDIVLTAVERESLFTAAQKQLDAAAVALRPHVVEVQTLILEGVPAECIEATVRERHIDEVVMGTHGHRGISRLLLGSVSSAVLRTSNVPVTTVPSYVALARNDAGARLAPLVAEHGVELPAVVALSRGAIAVASELADRLNGTLDLWAVEAVVTAEGDVIGTIGEDGELFLEGAGGVGNAARDEAVAVARARLRSEVSSLRGSRSIGTCWRRDIVLVADGLFTEAYVRVAIDALMKLGPRKIVIATPIIARDVAVRLEAKGDRFVSLERATVSDTCTYRDDGLPSDAVAYELLLAPRDGARWAERVEKGAHAQGTEAAR